jgi:hypothetical protein
MLGLLFALSCGGGSGPTCLQVMPDFCECWNHLDSPLQPSDQVISSCGKESIPPASGSGLFTMTPACCAEMGYPASGKCFCTEFDSSAPGQTDCEQIFQSPAMIVDRCATGGKLLTSNP